MELGTLKNLMCSRCLAMTQHVLESGGDGKERWWCLCGLAIDGTDRQVQTEGELV
jgi:hypothetical protein